LPCCRAKKLSCAPDVIGACSASCVWFPPVLPELEIDYCQLQQQMRLSEKILARWTGEEGQQICYEISSKSYSCDPTSRDHIALEPHFDRDNLAKNMTCSCWMLLCHQNSHTKLAIPHRRR
jgi:hypothetical protein